MGKSLASEVSFVLPSTVVSMISIAGLNSERTCLHAPQGGRNSGSSEAMAMARRRVLPLAAAWKAEFRYAQIVRE